MECCDCYNEYVCSHTGKDVPQEDARRFCNSEVSSQNCPYQRGDPVLTQEIGDQISSVFDSASYDCGFQLSQMVIGMCDIARETSMYTIHELCIAASNSQIVLPSVTGIYQNMVKLSSERRIAQSLENKLERSLYELQPKLNVGTSSYSDEPQVSAQDFYRLLDGVGYYGQQAANRWYFSIGLSGEASVFAEPAKNLAEQTAIAISNLAANLSYQIQGARENFENALRLAESGASSFSGNILSSVPFDWHFND